MDATDARSALTPPAPVSTSCGSSAARAGRGVDRQRVTGAGREGRGRVERDGTEPGGPTRCRSGTSRSHGQRHGGLARQRQHDRADLLLVRRLADDHREEREQALGRACAASARRVPRPPAAPARRGRVTSPRIVGPVVRIVVTGGSGSGATTSRVGGSWPPGTTSVVMPAARRTCRGWPGRPRCPGRRRPRSARPRPAAPNASALRPVATACDRSSPSPRAGDGHRVGVRVRQGDDVLPVGCPARDRTGTSHCPGRRRPAAPVAPVRRQPAFAVTCAAPPPGPDPLPGSPARTRAGCRSGGSSRARGRHPAARPGCRRHRSPRGSRWQRRSRSDRAPGACVMGTSQDTRSGPVTSPGTYGRKVSASPSGPTSDRAWTTSG